MTIFRNLVTSGQSVYKMVSVTVVIFVLTFDSHGIVFVPWLAIVFDHSALDHSLIGLVMGVCI